MMTEFLLPGVRVVYTDDEKAFFREQKAGTCLLTTADSGLPGADGYVECEADLEELTPDYISRIYDRHMGMPHELVRIFAAGGELSLRELSGKDYEDFLALSAQGGMGLAGYESPEHYMKELEQYRRMSEAERERALKRFGEQVLHNYRMLDYGLWMIFKDECAIGLAGLMPGEDGVYLGYLVDEVYRAKGIATLVCREIVHYASAELGITTLFAQAHVDNLPSRCVLRHLGFSPCGTQYPEKYKLKL